MASASSAGSAPFSHLSPLLISFFRLATFLLWSGMLSWGLGAHATLVDYFGTSLDVELSVSWALAFVASILAIPFLWIFGKYALWLRGSDERAAAERGGIVGLGSANGGGAEGRSGAGGSGRGSNSDLRHTVDVDETHISAFGTQPRRSEFEEVEMERGAPKQATSKKEKKKKTKKAKKKAVDQDRSNENEIEVEVHENFGGTGFSSPSQDFDDEEEDDNAENKILAKRR